MTDTTLVVVSPLRGFLRPNGKIILTKKFIEGMNLYRGLWDGPILHLCEPADRESNNLDNIEIDRFSPSFRTLCAPIDDDLLRSVLPADSLVVASVGEHFNSVSSVCKEIGISCVYITEYSLRTRHQIISEYQRGVVHGAWQKLRQVQQEIAQRKAISIADGVQCNGLPTYRAYKHLSPNPHLFFDTRTEVEMLATRDQIEKRSFDLEMGRKLRLVFSGRLTLMKGVDDLLDVASHLRQSIGDWFEMSICGDGDYAATLKADIDKRGLGEIVKMRGNLDFKTELVPHLKEADIFVCCHRQGDPSCTYLETMACGVPVIGYANDAWSQLSEHANSGWVIRNGDTKAMATQMAHLYRSAGEIDREAIKSLEFAGNHTFEQTFARRIDHLKSLAA